MGKMVARKRNNIKKNIYIYEYLKIFIRDLNKKYTDLIICDFQKNCTKFRVLYKESDEKKCKMLYLKIEIYL